MVWLYYITRSRADEDECEVGAGPPQRGHGSPGVGTGVVGRDVGKELLQPAVATGDIERAIEAEGAPYVGARIGQRAQWVPPSLPRVDPLTRGRRAATVAAPAAHVEGAVRAAARGGTGARRSHRR